MPSSYRVCGVVRGRLMLVADCGLIPGIRPVVTSEPEHGALLMRSVAFVLCILVYSNTCRSLSDGISVLLPGRGGFLCCLLSSAILIVPYYYYCGLLTAGWNVTYFACADGRFDFVVFVVIFVAHDKLIAWRDGCCPYGRGGRGGSKDN